MAGNRSVATYLADGMTGVTQNWRVIARLSIAPALAWWLSTGLFGHSQAFFAPIAAILTLTVGVGRRVAVVVEIILGAALGIFAGELLVHSIGRGTWQLILVVALAVTCALFFRLAGVALTQAVITGVLLVAIVPAPGVADPALTRFVDAFLGGAVALLVIMILPGNPARDLDRVTRKLLKELSTILEKIATAMREFDAREAALALDQARATQPMMESVGAMAGSFTEMARLSPLRWRQRESVNERAQAVADLEHAIRNTRVLARRVTAMIRSNEPIPASLTDALEDLSRITGTAATDAPALIGVAERAITAALGELTINTAAVASQVRAIVADILLSAGAEHEFLDEVLDFDAPA